MCVSNVLSTRRGLTHPLGTLQLCEFARAVDLDARTKDFDLVGVHGSVGDQNLRILHPLRRVGGDGLVKDEALMQ